MKKIIFLSAAVTALFSINAKAQTGTVPSTGVTPASSTATLNVRLYPIQVIRVDPSQKTVNLDYKNMSDYENGVSIEQKNHLGVYSTGAFTVSVQSADEKLKNSNYESDNIDSKDISITATKGAMDTGILKGETSTGPSFNEVFLTQSAQELINSDTGGSNLTFNITYTAKGDQNAYINKYHNAEKPTVYTTNVIYTIAAK